MSMSELKRVAAQQQQVANLEELLDEHSFLIQAQQAKDQAAIDASLAKMRSLWDQQTDQVRKCLTNIGVRRPPDP